MSSIKLLSNCGRYFRNSFCLIVAAAFTSGVLTNIGSQSTFGAPYVNIVAAGDWGCTGNTQETVKNVQKQNPDLLLALGDYSYASTSGCWFDLIRPIGSITKIGFGNHDVENSGLVNS